MDDLKNDFIKKLISNDVHPLQLLSCSEKYKEYAFDLYFSRFLNLFNDELKFTLDKYDSVSFFDLNKKLTIKDNIDALHSEIYALSIRTLIYEINEKRLTNSLMGETSEQRYAFFNQNFSDAKYFTKFTDKYPVLIELIENLVRNRIRLIDRCLERLANDYEEVTSELALSFDEIKNVKLTSGDTHNNGQKVVLIVTNGGNVIYKPHSLSTDVFFNHLIEYVNKKHILKYRINFVPSIDKIDYGWQTYIEFKACHHLNEVERFYYRMGVNLAFSYIIGITDIHFENLICSGEDPFMIDLETLIANPTAPLKEKDNRSVSQKLNSHLNESVFGTNIIPFNFKNSMFDFDMSAMATPKEQVSDFWQIYEVKNDFTDEICLEKVPAKILETFNYVLFKGEKIEPYQHMNDLVNGFEDSYLFALENHDEFRQYIMNLVNQSDITVRQVFRPTSVYGKFIEAGTHPNYLKGHEDRQNLMSLIKKQNNQLATKQDELSQLEIDALINNDVPYFTTHMKSNDLKGNKSKEVYDFFELKLVEILEKRLAKVSLEDLELQLYYIRLSLSTSVPNNWLEEEHTDEKLNHGIPYLKKGTSYLAKAKEIGNILEKYVVWNEDQTACTWLMQLIDHDKLKLGGLNGFLYEGGGVIIFLVYLARETKDEQYKRLAYAGLKGIEEQINETDFLNPLSAFNGMGSLAYLYYTLYQSEPDKQMYEKYSIVIEKMINIPLKNQSLDFVTGLSGLLVMIVNIYEIEKDVRLKKWCQKVADYMFEQVVNDESLALTGISHGYAGFQLAFAKAGACLKEEKFFALVNELVKRENKSYDEKEGNWADLRNEGEPNFSSVFWCHGAPGIALSRALTQQCCHEKFEFLADDVHRGVDKLIEEGFSDDLDHSVCHGVFGNIDILITLSKIMGDPKYLEVAHHKSQRCLNQIESKRVKFGLSHAFDLMSFMLGITGMGYVLLRLHNEKIPSVLSLEIHDH